MSSPAESVPLGTYYRKGDTVTVTIEKIVPRGFGLGFVENLTVLVPLVAVGDTVLVKIRECKKRLAFCEIVEIKRSGPARIPAPCPQYGVCGGCDFQHLGYKAQLEAKVSILRDCLTRIGKIEFDSEIPIVGSPQEFEYRSRARWHLDTRRQAFGYNRRDSNDVVDIGSCPILTPGMQSTLDYLRLSTDWAALKNGQSEIEAVSGEGGRISTHSPDLRAEAAEIDIELAGETYAYSAETFFQANRSLIPKLIETAIGEASGGTAIDLYCGVGLFSVPLARRFAKVTGVEGNWRSIKFARKNTETARLDNVELVHRSVEQFLTSGKKKSSDFVLLDPPRTGPESGVIAGIVEMQPDHISYVSCEPSILARDLRQLLDSGYAIRSLNAFDLFPQTHHVETVVQLGRQ